MPNGNSKKSLLAGKELILAAVTIFLVLGGLLGYLIAQQDGKVRIAQEEPTPPPEAPPEEPTLTPEDCYATIDAETGEQTNPDCPAPASDEAMSESGTAEIAQLHKLDTTCPPPTTKDKGGKCVLDSDVVLTETLDLSSFTHLNCKGHKLTPSSPGTPDNQATTSVNEYVASVPSAAILLHSAFGVKIQNCNFENFDFGIVDLKSKISTDLRAEPGSLSLLTTKILNNTLKVKYRAFEGNEVDAVMISGNTIELTYPEGNAIQFNFDNDLNTVSNNSITMPAGSLAGFCPGVPGGPAVAACVGTPQAIRMSGMVGAVDTGLRNFIIGGELIQVKFVDGEWPEDNVFEGNTITIANTADRGISADQRPIRTIIRGNTIQSTVTTGPIASANAGILHAGGAGRTIVVSGTCTGDSNRYCRTSSDCNIAGFPSVGTCTGAVTKTYDVRPQDSVIENNTITGFRGDGISTSCQNCVVKGNTISGVGGFGIQTQMLNGRIEGNIITNSGNNTTTGGDRAGINIFGACFNTCTVTRNTLSANDFGISVDRGGAQDTATAPRAKVFLNDITGSTKWPAHTFNLGTTPTNYQSPPNPTPSGALSFPFELSDMLRGNYWGRSCSDSDGFREAVLYRTTPFGTVDSSDPRLVDSHPYGQSVATTPDSSLPSTCI